jgi:hypothetical protein
LTAAFPSARDQRGASARGGRCFVALLLALLYGPLLAPQAQSADGADLLTELKVAYIYNFTRFIHWPEVSGGRRFCIGVIGDPALEAGLRVLEQDDKRADGRPIEVRAYGEPDTIGPCEILFVGAAASDRLGAIVRRTTGKPTVLVGDTPGYVGRGVAIELFRKPDVFRRSERLRFRIDPAALKGRGLTVSAQLYDVAEVVE